ARHGTHGLREQPRIRNRRRAGGASRRGRRGTAARPSNFSEDSEDPAVPYGDPMSMTSPPPTGRDFAKLGTRALAVLTLINMFNYIDRYIVPPLFESLRTDPAMGHPSDAQLGGLMTAFLVVYMLISPLFGTLGDRMSRMRLIAFGL